ncbi:uncharacterized protein [Epargyreus clarus]|uniref:uncharacterized protein n=1 Tax=Epargyreus clarus TaxID=520877 RepID=UPI003C2BE8E4
MKSFSSFGFLLLVGIAFAAPPKSADDETVVVTKDFYPDSFVKYKSQHDIVNIVVPLNSLNFDENESGSSEETDITLFFVEADKNGDELTYQGLYVFKNDKATKLLDNGRDAGASSDDSKQVFLAAQDGLYEYKAETKEAVKYGSVTDSIIGIAVTNTSDIIYILTEDHEVYKVTDGGNTKTKVEEVVNAKEIVLDFSNNLYFYADDKEPYVLTADGVKKINGLPSHPTKVRLVKPPFIIDDGVPFISDTVAYIIYANGTCEPSGFEFKPKVIPTAFGMEGTLIQYFGYNKKIYEYNILAMVLGEILDDLKNFLEDKKSSIETLAQSPRRNKHA